MDPAARTSLQLLSQKFHLPTAERIPCPGAPAKRGDAAGQHTLRPLRQGPWRAVDKTWAREAIAKGTGRTGHSVRPPHEGPQLLDTPSRAPRRVTVLQQEPHGVHVAPVRGHVQRHERSPGRPPLPLPLAQVPHVRRSVQGVFRHAEAGQLGKGQRLGSVGSRAQPPRAGRGQGTPRAGGSSARRGLTVGTERGRP